LSLAKKDYANAVAKFDRQLTVREDALGLYGRGRAKLSAGDSKGALTDIDKAIAKDPSNPALQAFRTQMSGTTRAELSAPRKPALENASSGNSAAPKP
jgi:tetratricopeptide (TPR) repeat protein